MAKKWTNQVKLAWLKAMEVLGTSASNLASNAKHKVTEINLETRRREILTDFSMKALDLWQQGERLPEPLETMLKELSEVDERLSVLRAEKYASVTGKGKGKDAEQEQAEETSGGDGDAALDGAPADVQAEPQAQPAPESEQPAWREGEGTELPREDENENAEPAE